MLEKYSIHTDLALEEKERFESDHVEVQGVILEEEYDKEREIRITKVKIETEKGARAMGKPVGTYITMEAPNMAVPDEEYHREISEELAKYIKELIKIEKEDYVVLVAGLGNRQVTPDALGPHVVDNLAITRHIVKEYGKYAMGGRCCAHDKRNRSRGYGADRYGDIRDHQRDCKRDKTGFGHCGGCACRKEQQETESNHSDCRYGN